MNTSKQINVMIGLLFIGALGTLLYFLWDNVRDTAATERQLQVNAERGGRLFSLNCRACHGLNGLGALESSELPGAPLNTDANREADAARQLYLRKTIECGRVGTVMPPWAIENGGSLNDFQIDQLLALITGTMTGFDQDPQASLDGWQHAVEEANHADTFVPAKHLQDAVGPDVTSLVLNQARGLRPGQMLRIDDDPEDQEDYEVVTVIDAPAESVLDEKAGSADTELVLQDATLFEPGDVILIDDEMMEVVDAPARSALSADLPADATTVDVIDGDGFAANEFVLVGVEKMRIESVSGDTLEVVRGVDESEAVEHTETSEIFETGVADKLSADVDSSSTTIAVNDGEGFREDQVVQVGREKMLVVSVSGDELEVQRGYDGTKARAHDKDSPIVQLIDVLEVERGVEGTTAESHDIKRPVYETGNEVTVERGSFGTDAADHEAGTEVFNGPITPPDTVTGSGEGLPPCGQQAPPEDTGTAAEVTVSGSADVTLGDNFFDAGGNQNPTFKVVAGSAVTFNLANNGNAPHNMRIAGADGEFETDDDSVSVPDLIPAATGATLQFTPAAAGTTDYRCDFHADQMKGQVTVE